MTSIYCFSKTKDSLSTIFVCFQVDGNVSIDAILEDLTCPIERMQAQEPPASDDDLYSYRRGDIPIFNFDEADRVLIATLQELIEALRKLKAEVNIQKQETMLLRKALQECKACRIKRPECSDDPPPCFPKVECRDTNDGPVCGPCPQGFKGDGRFCERDACSEDPCYPGVQCYDADAPPFFRCGPCPEGYRGDGINCIPSACEQRPPPCFQVFH